MVGSKVGYARRLRTGAAPFRLHDLDRIERLVLRTVRSVQSSVPELARLMATGVPTLTALTRAGLSYVNQGRFETAVGLFRVALALDPGNPVAWTNWGVALDRAGQSLDDVRNSRS
jgi:tetratricopeptide (TPR) repeat protein